MKYRFVDQLLKNTLAISIALHTLGNAAQAQTNDTEGERSTGVLEEIIITGVRASALSQREAKRNSDNISDSIFAEDIGKLPDENIAEAMQRITGVSIAREDGEGTQVTIRGVDPNLNLVTLNGVPLASGADGQAVDFSNLSADVLRSIEVVKSPSANHDEGSLGGTVNLNTFRPLDAKSKRAATIQFQQDELADELDVVLKGSFIDQFLDDKLGVAFSVFSDERSTRTDGHGLNNWQGRNVTNAVSLQTGEALGNISSFEPALNDLSIKFQDRVRRGGTATFEYDVSEATNLHFDLSYSVLNQDFTQHQTRIVNARSDGSVYDEESGSLVVGIATVGGMGRGNVLTRSQETETTTTTLGLGIEHSVNNSTISGEIGFSRADQEWLENRRVNFRPPFSDARVDWLDENGNFYDIPTVSWGSEGSPADFFDTEQTFLFQLYDDSRLVQDDYDSIKVDYVIDFDSGLFTSFEAGMKYYERTKDRSQTQGNTPFSVDEGGEQVFLADFQSDFPVDDYWSGVANNAYSGWPVPDLELLHDTYLPDGFAGGVDEIGTYIVEENAKAGYAMLRFSGLDDRLRGDVGVRLVKTELTSNGAQGITFPAGSDPASVSFPISREKTYSNVLPSFNLIWAFKEDMLLRASAAAVMARPSLANVRPGTNVIASNLTNIRANGGNPLLDPTEANQYDISWEWYHGDSGLVSAALFFKDIDSFTFTQTLALTVVCPEDVAATQEVCSDGSFDEVPFTSTNNGDGGSIKGLELAYQQDFTALPGVLSHLGGIFNYTYADSEGTYISDEVDNSEFFEGFPFLNTSKDTINATLYWERDGHSVRLAYNFRSASLHQAIQNNGSIWTDDRTTVDMSGKFRLTDSLDLTFAANNLTNESNRRFVTRTIGNDVLPGEGNALDGGAPTWRTNRLNHIGRSYRVGLNYSF